MMVKITPAYTGVNSNNIGGSYYDPLSLMATRNGREDSQMTL